MKNKLIMKKSKYHFYISNSFNQLGIRVDAPSFEEALKIFRQSHRDYKIKAIRKGNSIDNSGKLIHTSL